MTASELNRSSEVVEFITARLDEEEHDAQGAAEEAGARTLRGVAAMRALLKAHVGYYGPGDDEFLPVPTLRILARVWDDHEDYPDALGADGARDVR